MSDLVKDLQAAVEALRKAAEPFADAVVIGFDVMLTMPPESAKALLKLAEGERCVGTVRETGGYLVMLNVSDQNGMPVQLEVGQQVTVVLPTPPQESNDAET